MTAPAPGDAPEDVPGEAPGPTPPAVRLGTLGFERGAHMLVQRALRDLRPGQELAVAGDDPMLPVHLRAWCRERGHRVRIPGPGEHWPDGIRARVVRGRADLDRWAGAVRAGGPGPDGLVARPPAAWGLAARGALVEDGGPAGPFDLADRDHVWADVAPALYARAAAEQWDPARAVDWDAGFTLPGEVERAVVQVMTYLVENEQAALVVPARLLARIHPHFREVQQLLAVQAADEARHMEVFTRRALLRGGELGTSSAGGRESLHALLTEPDFSLASFLLSVLGEGSFLNLLGFLERHAPDPLTRRITALARRDEARHVAFGVAHLHHRGTLDPALRGGLRAAVERRHDALVDTAGLNQDVFDSLVVLAAGEWTPEAVGRGFDAVLRLQAEMDEGRQRRLVHLGFPADEAAELSALHTRNFM
ncbi:ferritin-like domain-containing protein [Streptomyces sp. TRM 70361]|uniref:ferritin-like domain-containing protein n=1 Tax=Streptomyces sp. TRM 70361 TaxID=3116553 RepID=UPI002E7C2F22|nr:ferritin-like domain-containing protein [Streptomyces sp. TRM 70361]MEE1938029.1 ferritin-like domain-containing protein [Streptomyces sp. TRM 70361]